VSDDHVLIPMGAGEPEAFRCRIYGAAEDPDEAKRREFVAQLAGPGVLDCPAIDPWVAALQERGWLPEAPVLEPHPDGIHKAGRWYITAAGRDAWAAM
jgi:hypothetical protein